MVYYQKIGKIYHELGMFLTVKQKILVTLLEKGPLQNSQIAKQVGITEQWCSEIINALHAEGLIESRFITPRRINTLTDKGKQVAEHLEEIKACIITKNVDCFRV